MSDIHVLEQAIDLKTIIVGLHYPIAGGLTNFVNKSYRDIIKIMENNGPPGMTLVNPDTGVLSSAIPFIDDEDFNPAYATEPAQITNGEVLEVIRTFRFSTLNLTPLEKRAEIEAYYNQVQTEILAELDKGIQFYGYAYNAS